MAFRDGSLRPDALSSQEFPAVVPRFALADGRRMESHYKKKIDKLLYSRTDEGAVRLSLLDDLWEGARFDNALDVGPGPGNLTRALAKRTRHLTLVERNGDYTATLQAQFPSAEIFIGSIEDFDVHRSAWNQILLSHVLYYFDETRWLPLCSRLHSALNPGGGLVIIINADRGEHWELLTRFRGMLGGRLGFGLLASSEFRRALGSVGPVTFKPYVYHIYHDSIEDAAEFVGRQLLEIGDEAVFEQHRGEFEAIARERQRGDGVTFTFEADLIRVQAQ
jgi:SAM-dependent methyltransferase